MYSLSSVYTFAAEPNPQVGLLDMVAVTTLGRTIYEENIRRKYGKSTEILGDGFRQLEKDIWRIAAKVLKIEQQRELLQLILLWRKNNPNKVVYNYLRFSDFAAQRRNFTLVKRVRASSLADGRLSTLRAPNTSPSFESVYVRFVFLGATMTNTTS